MFPCRKRLVSKEPSLSLPAFQATVEECNWQLETKR